MKNLPQSTLMESGTAAPHHVERWELLHALPPAQREAVLALTAERRYGAKDVLFHVGDVGEVLHFVVSGRVAVRADTPDGDTATFAVMGPGQALGKLALLRRSRTRTASAVALDDVVTRVLHRRDFVRLRDQQPSVERFMVALLAARVDRLSRHLMEALYLPVDRRVARRLLEVARLYPEPGQHLLPLTQQDVASLAGTTRPTANGVLRDLQSAGVLTLGRGRLTIDNLPELVRRAE